MTGYNELDVEEIFEEDFEFLVIEENLIDLSFIIEEDESENEAIKWYSQCQFTARCFLVAMIFLSFNFSFSNMVVELNSQISIFEKVVGLLKILSSS